MKKIAFLLLLLTATVSATAFLLEGCDILGDVYYCELRRFSSYEELESFVNASRHRSYALSLTEDRAMAPTLTASSYSKTNIQVEGVDEADIVKTDGEYIYVISNRSVVIVKAYPAEEAAVLSKIVLNVTPIELFINKDKLAVFCEDVSSWWTTTTLIKVYDVSDRENPALRREVAVDGHYFDSRMIGEYVYVVASQPAWRYEDEKVILPKIYYGDETEEVSPREIYHSDVPGSSDRFAIIVAVNIQNDERKPTRETVLMGWASTMYVSLDNIYITFSDWSRVEKTLIYRFHVDEDEIEYEADGEVSGRVLNQFSMDEYEGCFRMATTTWVNGASQNSIYTLDMELNTVGRLESLAPGESIYPARFMGDKCYLVTFRQVDPFFIIDLKDPSNLEVLGWLKIPGFSSYLHPYDENHIIGIGKEESAVKMSLFDVSNVSDPLEIGKYTVGVKSDSPVLSDHKAFLFDKSKNLLAIPVSITKTNYYARQDAYVFHASLDEGFVLKGTIRHTENDDYYSYLRYSVKRVLYIENVLYTISNGKVRMNSLDDLSQVNEVLL